ncbi:MAG TPA: hypothetical protein VFM63_09720 [Pyrinomonadaceae bacterium]|nr:hypothetical protein [Pyrinomonadaceae bacterium]
MLQRKPASPITANQLQVIQPARGGRGGGGGGPMRRTKEERKLARDKANAKALIKQANKTEETLRLAGKPETYAGSKYAEERLLIATTQSKGVSFQTGFGPTTITYSGTGQVMVSSKKTDFPGTYRKGTSFKEYADWARELDKSPQHRKQFAKDILALMKNNDAVVNYKNYTAEQKRAAALLITTTSTSEEFRVDGARKLARAALTLIINHNKSFSEAFGDPGVYPMTGGQGTSYTRNLMDNADQELTTEEVLLMSCMSPVRETDPDGS